MAPEDSSYYDNWVVRHMFFVAPTVAIVREHVATYEDYPPRQTTGSFTPRQ